MIRLAVFPLVYGCSSSSCSFTDTAFFLHGVRGVRCLFCFLIKIFLFCFYTIPMIKRRNEMTSTLRMQGMLARAGCWLGKRCRILEEGCLAFAVPFGQVGPGGSIGSRKGRCAPEHVRTHTLVENAHFRIDIVSFAFPSFRVRDYMTCACG